MTKLVGKSIKINGSKYKVKSQLGEGGFAFVYAVKDEASKRNYALKRVETSDRDGLNTAKREWKWLENFGQHENIVTLHYGEQKVGKGGATEILLLMDCCSGGNVVEIMNKNGILEEKEIKHIFRDVLSAVVYLHSQSPAVFHRDLKLENVLYDDVRGVYKLCDFNSATTTVLYTAGGSFAKLTEWEEEIDKHTTPSYRSPEMVDLHKGMQVDYRSDIWALGCMLYMLCFRRHPFETGSKLEIMSARIEFPRHSSVSDHLKELISCMLVVDPSKRPSAEEISKMLQDKRYEAFCIRFLSPTLLN